MPLPRTSKPQNVSKTKAEIGFCTQDLLALIAQISKCPRVLDNKDQNDTWHQSAGDFEHCRNKRPTRKRIDRHGEEIMWHAATYDATSPKPFAKNHAPVVEEERSRIIHLNSIVLYIVHIVHTVHTYRILYGKLYPSQGENGNGTQLGTGPGQC